MISRVNTINHNFKSQISRNNQRTTSNTLTNDVFSRTNNLSQISFTGNNIHPTAVQRDLGQACAYIYTITEKNAVTPKTLFYVFVPALDALAKMYESNSGHLRENGSDSAEKVAWLAIKLNRISRDLEKITKVPVEIDLDDHDNGMQSSLISGMLESAYNYLKPGEIDSINWENERPMDTCDSTVGALIRICNLVGSTYNNTIDMEEEAEKAFRLSLELAECYSDMHKANTDLNVKERKIGELLSSEDTNPGLFAALEEIGSDKKFLADELGDAHSGLAKALETMGRNKEAVEHYKLADDIIDENMSTVDPEHDWYRLEEIRARIAELSQLPDRVAEKPKKRSGLLSRVFSIQRSIGDAWARITGW